MTASAGELTREFEINCDKEDAGVEGVDGSRTVVKEVWYNTNGVQVPEPSFRDGAVYMVIRTYDDGTMETLKVFNVE